MFLRTARWHTIISEGELWTVRTRPQRLDGRIARRLWLFSCCQSGCGCVDKPGWLLPLRMAKRVSERAPRGGERRNAAVSGRRIRGGRLELPSRSVWTRRVHFLALAGSAARRLGDAAARRPAGGSSAQWERPRNQSFVTARDRTTKPNRQWLRVVSLKTTAGLLHVKPR